MTKNLLDYYAALNQARSGKHRDDNVAVDAPSRDAIAASVERYYGAHDARFF